MSRYWVALLFISVSVFVVSSGEDEADLLANSTELEESGPEKIPRDPTFVTVLEGMLRGVKEEAIDGKLFYSFRGIPYAKPPVGRKRFRVSSLQLDILQ